MIVSDDANIMYLYDLSTGLSGWTDNVKAHSYS